MTPDRSEWRIFFSLAALFNYCMGLPILFASEWSYSFSFVPGVGRDPMAIRLWADFGFAVVLIGFGYQLVARSVQNNRGIVLLGIIAKLFDVVNLSWLTWRGYAHARVLVPAAIDTAALC
jgi:hypothetical protein